MSNVTRAFRQLCVVVCFFSPLAHAGAVLDDIRAKGRIVLAHRESSVPFSYLNAQGKPVGYALDICERLASAVQKHLGVVKLGIEYLQVTPSNRIDMVEQGKAHLECGSTTNNASRRERVAFTVPHFITGARLLVRAGSAVERLDDPAVKSVVSTKNTTPLAAVRRIDQERLLRLRIIEAPDHARAVEMVESGEADAFAMDDVLLYGLAAGRPKPGALKVVGRFLTTEPLAIMLPKGDGAFKKVIDDEMRRLIYSAEIHAIYRTWFESPIPPSGSVLNMPISYLLRDFWKYPTDQVPF